MGTFVAQVMNGLALGSVYALVVLGVNLLALVRGVVHFAYSHTIVLSMFAAGMVLKYTNNNLAIGIITGICAGMIGNVLTEPLFRRLTRRKALMESMVLSMGIGIVITDVISHNINNGIPVSFPSNIAGGGISLHVGEVFISMAHILTIAGTVVAGIGFWYFLYHHKQGRAFRAIAQDVEKARLLGIPIGRTGVYSFAIAGILAGVSGLFLAMILGSASAVLGDSLAIKAIIVALLGGLGNLKGGVVTGLSIGLVESLAMGYIPGLWTQAVVFGVVMVLIIIRPFGLFGTRA
jgi:branched-chain amino acid transport system permease protein